MNSYKYSFVRALVLKASDTDSLVQAFFHPLRIVKVLRQKGLTNSIRIVFQIIRPANYVKLISPSSISPSLSLEPFTKSRILAKTSFNAQPRVNVITDSLKSDSLFGGVLTSIIIGCQLANRFGMDLRIISTQRLGGQLDVTEIAAHLPSLKIPKIQYAYIPNGSLDSLEATADDIYLPTSSWTCQTAIRSFPSDRIFYILQEDERIFFPSGDVSNEAQNVILNSRISFLINSKNLRDHLIQSGCWNLREASVSFEPSFDLLIRMSLTEKPIKEKHRMAFYARPNHHRNMFRTGLLAIDSAFKAGLVNEQEWEIDFIGGGLPFSVDNLNFVPNFIPKMKYLEYAEYLKTIDIGIALMASPHPGYPVFDFAASGAMSITNKWPGKIEFGTVSENVIVADSSVEGLMDAISQGTKRISESSHLKLNRVLSPYNKNWETNLSELVDFVGKRLSNV